MAITSYTKKTWENGEKILATALNNIENGIEYLSNQIAAAVGSETSLNDRLNNFNTIQQTLNIEYSTTTSINFNKNELTAGEINVNTTVDSINNFNRIEFKENTISTNGEEDQIETTETYVLPLSGSHENDMTYSILTSKDTILKRACAQNQSIVYTFPNYGCFYLLLCGQALGHRSIYSGRVNAQGQFYLEPIHFASTTARCFTITANTTETPSIDPWTLTITNTTDGTLFSMMLIFQGEPTVSVITPT